MKIYLVTKSLSGVVGGVERQLGNIAHRLSQSGHEISILTSDYSKPELFFKQLHQFPTLEYGVKFDKPTSLNKQRLARQKKIFNIIQQGKPDLVIGFMLSGFLVALPSSICTRTPIVLAERNSPDVYNLTRAKKFKFLYFQLMRLSAGITVQLDSYKNRYPKYLKKKIKIIYNEIMITPRIAEDQKSVKPFTFGFVGRFSYQKQPIELIDSFARHKEKNNDSLLVFIGKGELEQSMRDRIKFLNMDEYVTIRSPETEINEIYNSLNVICLPSLWEGFPNVVGEAMMCGLPVLGSKNCLGLADLVTPNTGVLVDFNDPEIDGFTEIINLVAKNRKLSFQIKEHFEQFQACNFKEKWNEVALSATKQTHL